jgi:hypothetical protein
VDRKHQQQARPSQEQRTFAGATSEPLASAIGSGTQDVGPHLAEPGAPLIEARSGYGGAPGATFE